jgi:hypothetical protein
MTTTESDPRGAAAAKLIDALAAGDPDAVRALFSGPAEIDDPFAGRHVDGGFERTVRAWRPVQGATVEDAEVTSSTTQGRFNGTEITLRLAREDGRVELPIVVVSEHAEDGRIERSRLYYRRARIDGRQHHRWPILDSQGTFVLNEALAAYQKALREGDVEGMMATFGPDFHFDGHGQSQDLDEGLGMGRYDREQTRAALVQMFGLNPQGGATIEHLNVIDDGTTTVLEFNLHQGVPEDPQVRAHAGVACYELGAGGLIKEARVYDEAW